MLSSSLLLILSVSLPESAIETINQISINCLKNHQLFFLSHLNLLFLT